MPLLRRSAPSAIVNVASPRPAASRARHRRILGERSSRWRAGSTRCISRRRAHGVHVGLVLPGFVATEGFPQRELVDTRLTRWLVSTPERVADAIVHAGPGGKAERYVPRPYWLAAAARTLLPRAVRRATGGSRSCS